MGAGTDDASEKLYMEPPHNRKPSTGKRTRLKKSDQGGIEIVYMAYTRHDDGEKKSDQGGIEIRHASLYLAYASAKKSDQGGIEIDWRICCVSF